MSRFLPLLALLVAGPALAQTGTVAGRVVDAESGQPLPGATVQSGALGVSADAAGRFRLDGLRRGVTDLVVSFVGYETVRQSVGVEAGETATVTVRLAEAAGVLDAVVVTGERTARRAQETVSSAAVFAGDRLQAQQVLDLDDVFERAANVSIDGKIRGYSTTDGQPAGVALVLDGAVTASPSYTDGFYSNLRSSLWDVEAVEILRGPQSTTQGANAFAGAIVVRSKRPTTTWDAAARLSGATGDEFVGSVALGGPVVGDQLAFRASADVQQQAGFIVNPGADLDDVGENDVRAFRGALLFEPTALPGFSALLTADLRSRDVGEPRVDVDDDPFDNETAQPFRRADESTERVVLELGYGVAPGVTLTSVSALNDRDFDLSGGDIRGSQLVSYRALTQELRANVTAGRLSGVAGLFYAARDEETPGYARDVAFPPIAFGISEELAAQYPDIIAFDVSAASFDKRDNVAAYAELDVEALPGVTLTAGGRIDREWVEGRDASAAVLLSEIPDPADVPASLREEVEGFNGALLGIAQEFDISADTDDVVFLPKAGVRFDLADDVLLGFTAQRAYNSGGVSIATSGRTSQFDPEYVWNYEAAFRSEWLDRRLRVNANAFYADWTDQQVTVFPTGTTEDQLVVNAGRSHLMGGEFSVGAVPAVGLDLFGTVGYVETEFDEFVDGDVDFAGNAFALVPAWTASAGGSYEHRSGLFAGAEVTHRSSQFTSPENDPEVTLDALTMVDARVGFRLPEALAGGNAFRLTVFARNLLDERALTGLTYFYAAGPAAEVNEPRVVGVRLDWSL